MAVLLRTISDCDLRAQARALNLPTLVITGARDRVVPPAQSRWLATTIAEAEYVELQGVGHMPNLEALDELVLTLRSWLSL